MDIYTKLHSWAGRKEEMLQADLRPVDALWSPLSKQIKHTSVVCDAIYSVERARCRARWSALALKTYFSSLFSECIMRIVVKIVNVLWLRFDSYSKQNNEYFKITKQFFNLL